MALSAVFGAVLGFFYTSTWQVAVETAQVVAGLVEYPPENAFYRYHMSAWTLVHQLSAGMLWLGVDSRSLCLAISSLLTAATFGGLTLCCHALSRNAALAIAAPLAWFALFCDANAYGVAYPLVLTGTHHTYGVLGRAAALWLAGLAAHRNDRAALFLAGVSPALHITWGIYATGVVGLAVLVASTQPRTWLQRWPWFAAGALVTGLSFVWQRFTMSTLPEVDPEGVAPLLEAFLAHWDGHRIPTSIVAPGTLVVVLVAFGAAAWLFRARSAFDERERLFLAIVVVAGATGFAGLCAAQFPEWLPAVAAAAMPGRFANFALLLLPAVLIGIPTRTGGRAGAALLGLLGVYLAWNWIFEAFLSSDKYGWSLAHWKWVSVLLIAGVVAALRSKPSDLPPRVTSTLRFAVAGLAIGVVLLPKGRVEPLWSTPEDPVIAHARKGQGLIITGPGMELMQLRTGRPILLNTGALDQLPYVPESGPAMNAALERVYGVSLVDPPEAIRKRRVGALPPDTAIDLFAHRALDDWQAIAREFGGSGSIAVLTGRSHALAFGAEIESEQYRYYAILLGSAEE